MSHEEKSLVEHRSGTLVLRGEDGKATSTSFPGNMADVMAKEALRRIRELEVKKTVWKATEGMYELVMKPDLQGGLDAGRTIMYEGSVDIRDATTKRFVGKAQLEKVDPKSLADRNPLSPISSVTGVICTLSGQIQLAELSRKMDVIIEKVDEIREDMWREKITALSGHGTTIDRAMKKLPDQLAMDRINGCIKDLESLKDYFYSHLVEVLKRQISPDMLQAAIEGLEGLWNKERRRQDYDQTYLDSIRELLWDAKFLVDCYSHSISMLGLCYQAVGDYGSAREYMSTMQSNTLQFSKSLFEKTAYLLEVKTADAEGDAELDQMIGLLEGRRLDLGDTLPLAVESINRTQDLYNRFAHQFDGCEIILTVSSSELYAQEEVDSEGTLSVLPEDFDFQGD